ncbi:type IV pili methyl-accepting chemotaxis transducer N-terminal domain-containing protein [Yoonia litorea]|uniref:Type IV pili methyl-accepting chemotaxis transducer N-term n=1 Tax=Yoonia litorea TaxID=1123755 RepID=A0A1I6M9Z1_9RHOB|nr:type IV pili methyl-accepting chemotaxis transducer N-terminal domain-containing protein [Yoonia litorea]SFS12519.1 Type IV pili methyl-accepting chemotaxis transducer N-term [Yoonia litorea]
MKIRYSLALVLAASIGATTLPSITLAQSTSAETVETNAQQRINFSGKLRMLSQRIPSAACHFSQGIDPEGSLALLNAATAEFDKIITALEFGGDTDLNIIAAESRRKTLERIHQLHEQWDPLKTAAQAVASGNGSDADIDFILNNNMPVLRAAQLLVEELVKQYSNPNATTRAMLFLIDISGRQRMLTQKVSKESCMLGGPFETETTMTDLEGTIGIFEASLEALRFGMPMVGVNPPPNDAIFEGLNGVHEDWQRVTPLLTEIRAGNTLDAEQSTIKFQGLNTTMANMNTVVGMYTAAAGS